MILGIRVTDPIGSLVDGPVAVTGPTSTLREAAQALAASNLGLVVVLGPFGPQAVLSERDILSAVANGDDVDLERVRDHASDDLISVDETTPVATAARTMLDAEVRHLLVMRGPRLHGVVSLRVVAAAMLEELAVAD